MGESGFWDEPEAAGKVNAEYARLQRRLDGFERLSATMANAQTLTTPQRLAAIREQMSLLSDYL